MSVSNCQPSRDKAGGPCAARGSVHRCHVTIFQKGPVQKKTRGSALLCSLLALVDQAWKPWRASNGRCSCATAHAAPFTRALGQSVEGAADRVVIFISRT